MSELPSSLDATAGVLGLTDLPSASSLLSSRWSRDNLITSHPARLYDGAIHERIGLEALGHLIGELANRIGPIQTGACRMGVLTWDISCAHPEGPFTLQIPRVLDAPGKRGRATRDVPRLSVENARDFVARRLTRYVVEPRQLVLLGGDVPAAIFPTLPEHHPIAFGRGSIQIESYRGERGWAVPLGPRATADLLAEMIAALTYHYDPDLAGGTALTDVFVNDGDFATRRRSDGSFDVRLAVARRRTPGVRPELLLAYLVQLLAYEDWSCGDDLVGIPALISNPAVAFEGLLRGRRHRHRDTGSSEERGEREALDWIRDFGRSPMGRAYRPWVERFLDGRLPLVFGEDLREHWWRLVHVRQKYNLLELRGRQVPGSHEVNAARELRMLLDRLSLEIGRQDPTPYAVRINDLGRDELMALLAASGARTESHAALVDELLARWPHRSLDQLLASVPKASALRRSKGRLDFGHVVSEADVGTLKSLRPLPKEPERGRAIANPELYGRLQLPASLHTAAVRTFPSFQAYMDAVLHDETWGYYAQRVSIGRGGHFSTNPESLSPLYGKWIARWAHSAWRDLIAHGELTELDPFPVIEFGAGNGRLARDFLDAVAQQGEQSEAWRTFAARLQYRIYETSPSLRSAQQQLLGSDALVVEGDARQPERTLARDFPGGVRGLVVTNEVPDAFGVHKVVLERDGRASAALVLPRIEAELRDVLGDALKDRIDDTDRTLRRSFELCGNAKDCYLDAATFGEVMRALATHPAERREELLGALWFEEAYVPVAEFEELVAHLRHNAAQYATALAAEDSGVVIYVNVHASRFIRELGASLAAGFVITIDYGDTTWDSIRGARRGEFPFRIYRDGEDFVPRPNDPYTSPGGQDLTADVNFTDLAQAGRDVGLEVLHYGPERDVSGEDLTELLAASKREFFAEFLGNPTFKILVMGTRSSEFFRHPLFTPSPLWCREQDVAKSRRHRIPSLERALANPSAA